MTAAEAIETGMSILLEERDETGRLVETPSIVPDDDF